MATRTIQVGALRLGGGNGLFLIAGPCVIESAELCLAAARQIKAVAQESGIPLIFKASFDKANRSAAGSYRGPGFAAGLEILRTVRRELGLPVLTDIHETHQAEPVAEVADILQIPALLCRQTDLLLAAARTGRPVNLKKGQFMAPEDMRNAVEKVCTAGNEQVILTERGTTFGYHNLVCDMRGLPVMRQWGYPVVFDATHAVQHPGGLGNRSGGDRGMVPVLARAAVAAGVDGLFLEVHPDPERALSDGPNMLPIPELSGLWSVLKRIDAAVRESR